MKKSEHYNFLIERYSGWAAVVLFTVLPLIRWAQVRPPSQDFANFYSTMSTLGRMAGLIGMMLYAASLVMAIRVRWMERYFGGLNRVYIAHHLIGGISLILLCFHPLFLAVRYIEASTATSLHAAAVALLPKFFGSDAVLIQAQQALAYDAGIIAFWGMVVLLVITFFAKLPYRIWLMFHRFLGVAFVFAAFHSLFITSDINSDIYLKVYFAFWSLVGIMAYLYRSLLGNIFVRREPYRLDKITTLPGKVVALGMTPMRRKIDFKAGQFVFIRVPWHQHKGIEYEMHPFSIASAPNEDNLRLYIKSLGDYTTAIKNLEIGATVEIEGAFGKFSYDRFGNTPQIWIAGGIGVTPFLSMARNFKADGPPVDFYYSVAERSELLDQHALAEFLPAKFRQFRYFPFVAKELNSFLNAAYIANYSGDLRGKEIFVCGPPPMMKAMKAQLKAMGVKKRHIHSEEFGML